MRIGKLLAFGCFAAIGVGLMSCSKADVFDSNAANELKKEQLEKDYTSNFVKKYGAVEGKSWDFATMAPSYRIVGENSATRAFTRNGSYTTTKGSMIIEKEVSQWMFANMKAGKDNTKMGSPFYLKVPGNSFTIVPIFQGTASYYWELWMHVVGLDNDVKIWSKGEDLSYRESETSTEWKEAGTDNAGISKNAYEVKAPTYTYADLPEGKSMYFYLKVWNNYSDFKKNSLNYQPRLLSSLDHQMLALQGLDTPKEVPADNEVAIIGCEDAVGGDYDYEDLVFLMYGNPAPPIIQVKEVEKSVTKRYMMEDLGDADDFDFNDVVVDVTTTEKKKIVYKFDEYGSLVYEKEEDLGTTSQKAIVRAAGGTLDFTLKIGQTTWTKSTKFNSAEMLNTKAGEVSYNKVLDEFDVTGWDPKTNNVSVSVVGKGGDNGVQTVVFPKKCEAPMIIAVNETENWMYERTSVPTSWFTE